MLHCFMPYHAMDRTLCLITQLLLPDNWSDWLADRSSQVPYWCHWKHYLLPDPVNVMILLSVVSSRSLRHKQIVTLIRILTFHSPNIKPIKYLKAKATKLL